jgi:beta-phosphoglucomutase
VNLRDCFDACVSGEQVTHSKPAPDTFLKAAEELALPPGRCAVVEDAVQGVEAGKAAGMPVAAVTTTRKRSDLTIADIVVDSLAELTADDFVKLLTFQSR